MNENEQTTVLDLKQAYEDKNQIFWYWCNASGEVNVPGQKLGEHGTLDDMPTEAREVYKNFWNDGMSWACYVIQRNSSFGIGLFMPLDDDYVENIVVAQSEDLKAMQMSQQTMAAIRTQAGKRMAEQIAKAFPQATVFYAEDINDGDEVLVYLPKEVLTTQDDLLALADRLDRQLGASLFVDTFKSIALSGGKEKQ